MTGVISLELNELNFSLVEQYARQDGLTNFQRLLEQHRRYTTVAESEFSNVEPWIQWVTVHTGLDFAEHNVFRLGDFAGTDYQQIWEKVHDELGVRVGAVSPMNATLTGQPAFFVPDPWTGTGVVGGRDLMHLHSAIKEAVNENAQGGLSARSAANLVAGAARNLHRRNLGWYARLAMASRQRKWLRAGVLDLLLADTFETQWLRSEPGYSSLFLNAAAHVQHHYMYNSRHYHDGQQNPEWYVKAEFDPLYDIYRVYDRILGQLFALADRRGLRLLVVNGLSQVPNPEIIYYYRPLDHARLLAQLDIERVDGIEPRMSRDFLVRFADAKSALAGAHRLESVTASDGTHIFSVDNRGDDLFVKVAYTREMKPGLVASTVDRKFEDFDRNFVHVAIENAIHTTYGTLIDCGESFLSEAETIPLRSVFDYTFAVVQRECK